MTETHNASLYPPEHPPDPIPQAGRAMVRDVGAGDSSPARFDVRTAYDFAISLSSDAGDHDELPAEDRRWLERARAALPRPPALRPIDEELCIFGTRADRRPARRHRRRRRSSTCSSDAGQDVRRTPSSPTPAGPDAPRPRSRPPWTATGRRSTRIVGAWPEQQARLAVAGSSSDSDALAEERDRRSDAWLPLYQEMEPRVEAIIERDVELRADDRDAPARGAHRAHDQRHPLAVRARRPPRRPRAVVLRAPVQLHVLRAATGGCSSTRSRMPRSSRHDPLAPPVGVAAAPPGPGRRHPAPDPAAAQGPGLVPHRDRGAARALKPTIKHHLAQLRAAGLVTLTEEGGLSYYSLRRDRLDDASAELKRFLACPHATDRATRTPTS